MRLIRSGPLAPALNLALDEALLRSGTETLRIYQWEPGGLSLGFFQQAAAFVPAAQQLGLTLVRRPTGGGAIAHTGELTVAWIGRRRRVDEVYAKINAIVTATAAALGVTARKGTAQPEAAPAGFCFDAHTCYDLLSGPGKFFGSAQRRGGDRFLLHGTLVLEANKAAAGAHSLTEAAGRPISAAAATTALLAAAGERLGPLHAAAPTEKEWQAAEKLRKSRYAAESWTHRR